MKRFAAFLVALGLTLASAWPAAADPPMWRVKRGGAEIVLFGSVHVLKEGDAWRTPKLDAALAGADEVWFEIPTTAEARADGVTEAMRRGRLRRGERLSNLLPPDGRRLLARAVARAGLSPRDVEGFRPWFAEAMLSLGDLQRSGASQADGVEEQLSARAPATARRRAFETPAQQIRILAEQSTRDQVASLMQTLKEMETKPDAFASLQGAWVAGDVGWIEREAIEPMRRQTPRLYNTLVVQRNRRWATEIERMLHGEGRVFIVVGVGHLVGPESVPALLRRRGFTVEGP